MASTFGPLGDLDPRALYLDLLKRTLTGWIYGEAEVEPLRRRGFIGLLRRALTRLLAGRRGLLVRTASFDPALRLEGRDWPASAHTMIGLRRLDNLQDCVEDILARDVPGDFLEAGVWRGGASIFTRAILKCHGVKDRRVWLADSFAGLPPPDPRRYPLDATSRLHEAEQLAVPLDRVKANFDRYGLLDDQVRFLPGWFRDTLPSAPVDRLALIRLDGDMYESTMDAITSLYPKLSVGGFVIVDDYGAVDACKKAIHDYRERHGIADEIVAVDWAGAYWKKSR